MDEMNFKPRKAVLVCWLIYIVCGSLPVAAIVAGACSDSDIPPLLGAGIGAFVIWFLASLYAILYFHSINYMLDDRYVTKACGVVWKKRRSIPLKKITNIDVRQGPIERLLGFGQIWIFTPSTGASTPEEKLIGISSPHDMKAVIVERTERSKDTPPPVGVVSPGKESESSAQLLEDIKGSLLRIEELLKGLNKQS